MNIVQKDFITLVVGLLVYNSVSAVMRWIRSLRLELAGVFRRYRPELASWLTSKRQLLRQARDMSNEELLWALQLSPYRKSVKAVLSSVLAERGLSPAEVAAWLPAQAGLTLPPSSGARVDDSHYIQLTRWRSRLIKIFQAVLVIFFVSLVPTGMLGLLNLHASGLAPGIAAHVRSAPPAWLHLRWLETAEQTSVVLAELIVLIVASCTLALRSCNRRVLLLRPFGEQQMTQPLRRMVARLIGRVGHVYTLSDDAYRSLPLVSLIDRLPLFPLLGLPGLMGFLLALKAFLNPLFAQRHSFRITDVTNDRQFYRLQDFLVTTLYPSLVGFVSLGQAFNVRCSATWWRTTVLCLMCSSDVIVVDVSTVKEGTGWEIRQLKERGLLHRTVFVVGEPHVGDMGERLARLLPAQDMPIVFPYNAKGVLRDGQEVLARLVHLSGPTSDRQHARPHQDDTRRDRSGILRARLLELAAGVLEMLAFACWVVMVLAIVPPPAHAPPGPARPGWPVLLCLAVLAIGMHWVAGWLRKLARMERADRRKAGLQRGDSRRDRSGILRASALELAALLPDGVAYAYWILVLLVLVRDPAKVWASWPVLLGLVPVAIGLHCVAGWLRKLARMQRADREHAGLHQDDRRRDRSGILRAGALRMAAVVPDGLAFTYWVCLVFAFARDPGKAREAWPIWLGFLPVAIGLHWGAGWLRRQATAQGTHRQQVWPHQGEGLADHERGTLPSGPGMAEGRAASPRAPGGRPRGSPQVVARALALAALVPEWLAFICIGFIAFSFVHAGLDPAIRLYIAVGTIGLLGVAAWLRKLARAQRGDLQDWLEQDTAAAGGTRAAPDRVSQEVRVRRDTTGRDSRLLSMRLGAGVLAFVSRTVYFLMLVSLYLGVSAAIRDTYTVLLVDLPLTAALFAVARWFQKRAESLDKARDSAAKEAWRKEQLQWRAHQEQSKPG